MVHCSSLPYEFVTHKLLPPLNLTFVILTNVTQMKSTPSFWLSVACLHLIPLLPAVAYITKADTMDMVMVVEKHCANLWVSHCLQ